MNEAPRPGLAENLARVEDAIDGACRRSGRSRSEVELMAVSKTHAVPAILEAIRLGVTLFGENRVQEFQAKHAELRGLGYSLQGDGAAATEAAPAVRFHLIGHLQSNKTQRAAEIFSAVDALDSLRLASRLNDAAQRLQRRLPVLIEIKLGHEDLKTGIPPESPALRELLDNLPEMPALELRGLMTVPPYAKNPEATRPYFRELRLLRDRLAAAYPRLNLGELSMGMSHDFAVAIEEGATQVRVGTAVFGARPPAAKAL